MPSSPPQPISPDPAPAIPPVEVERIERVGGVVIGCVIASGDGVKGGEQPAGGVVQAGAPPLRGGYLLNTWLSSIIV